MKKSIIFSVHVIFWIILYYSIYTALNIVSANPWPPVGGSPFWTFEWLTIEIIQGLLIPFYTFYFLLPKLFIKRNRIVWYLTAFVFLISYPAIVISLVDNFKKIEITDYLTFFLFYMFFAFIGGLFKVFFKWIEQSKQKDNLEKQNLKSELALLKHQINPHFLFNTLNNVDSLINENNPKASLALNNLSDIMRYIIYDSEKEKVPLKEELAYIESYISLQKLRVADETKITFDITGNINNKEIAPMLLITFIENAFKHSSLRKMETA